MFLNDTDDIVFVKYLLYVLCLHNFMIYVPAVLLLFKTSGKQNIKSQIARYT